METNSGTVLLEVVIKTIVDILLSRPLMVDIFLQDIHIRGHTVRSAVLVFGW